MKFLDQAIVNVHARRAPQGARGLKCNIGHKRTGIDTSRPARGAWVEIFEQFLSQSGSAESRPARGAWVEIAGCSAEVRLFLSRPARGAWVEIAQKRRRYAEALSRPARGAWVEINRSGRSGGFGSSRPARGAWVEMNTAHQREVKDLSRAPQGARGLKLFLPRILRSRLPSRAPQGARGLKSAPSSYSNIDIVSRPARGAWVEMDASEVLRREG